MLSHHRNSQCLTLLLVCLLSVSAVSRALETTSTLVLQSPSRSSTAVAAISTTTKRTSSSTRRTTSTARTSSTRTSSSTIRTSSSTARPSSSSRSSGTSTIPRTTSAISSPAGLPTSSSIASSSTLNTTSSVNTTTLTSTSGSSSSSSLSSSTTISSAPIPTTTASNQTLVGNTVFAHFVVGNVYNYSVTNWAQDIALASSKGIDAFALNVGSDTWEPARVADAYTAATQFGTSFKLFLSFDMSSLPCTSASNIQLLQTYIKTYATHPNQLLVHNQSFISTFAGESCTFGASSVNQGWINAVKTNVPATYFVPSFFIDPATFPTYTVMDGAFNWNSGWPMTNSNITFSSDAYYLSNLGKRSYMGAVSPWFFTHYGVNSYNKNFIYRGDDWLFVQRWEMLIANRNTVNFTQALTWNDFGESHYFGPIEGMQPMSQSWVNGFDHQGWLDLMQYYISAYKTGVYPPIVRDRVYLWSRLYPTNATSPDTVPQPTNYQWTKDYLWAVVQATEPANVTLSCGNSTSTALVPAGVTKLKLPLFQSCAVNATIVRSLQTIVNFAPAGFNFNTKPPSYNFNAIVAASP